MTLCRPLGLQGGVQGPSLKFDNSQHEGGSEKGTSLYETIQSDPARQCCVSACLLFGLPFGCPSPKWQDFSLAVNSSAGGVNFVSWAWFIFIPSPTV